MTDHLPECHKSGAFTYVGTCICRPLRACEQRVRQTDWAADNAYWTGQTEGYGAALVYAAELIKGEFPKPTLGIQKAIALIEEARNQ